MTKPAADNFYFDFDRLYGKLSVPALMVESNSKVVALNDAAASLFRMPAEMILNQYWSGLDGQLNLIVWKSKLKELAKAGQLTYETDLVTADELLRPVSVEMVAASPDHTLLVLGNRLADVIDEADLELLSEEGEVGFWMYNRVDDILYLSPYIRKLANLPDAADALKIANQLRPHLLPKDWERLRPQIKSLLSEEGAFSQLLHFESNKGTLNLRFFAQSTGNALHVTRLFGMVRQENDLIGTSNIDSISGELATFSIDQSPDLIFWTRPDGTVSYANAAVSDLLGYSTDDLIGMHAGTFTEGFNDEARDEYWNMLRRDKIHSGTWTMISRHGKRFLIDARVSYLRFGDEEYTCGFCRDITEATAKVQRSLLSEFTIDHSRDMVLWTRPSGEIYFANAPFQQRTIYSWEEIQSMTLDDLFPSLDAAFLNNFWEKAQAGENVEGEMKLILRNKKQIPVLVRSSYLKFEGQSYCCHYLRDISGRRKRDAELALSHEALDHAADCIIWLGENYKIRYANQTLLGMLGKKREEVMGKPHNFIFPLLDQQNIEARDNMTVTLRTVNREDRKLNLNCSVINANGRSYYMLIGRDFTEMEESRQKLENAYAEITELKDRLEENNVNLKEEVNIKYNHNEIVTVSPKYQKVLYQMGQVADVDTTVLITGETGTGKELLARSIHNLSERTDEPLIKVNCAALPKNLIESELFGHEKGAFTGATARKKGRFEMADKGTLFLDEVGELPLELQSKLLRILQEDEFERLGGTETIKVDVRLIAATNRNLEQMVREGTFRSDLYYRLNVFPIKNLPLRDRPEDIPVLTKHFAAKFAKRQQKTIREISSVDLKRLSRYYFPGNIRELENLVERAVVLCKSDVLTIPFEDTKSSVISVEDDFVTLEEAQRRHIIAALRRTNGRVTGPNGAGILLGMNDRTLVSRMRKLDIKKLEYLS